MVRFSDMLGGNGDAQETRAPAAPARGDESPAPAPAPEPVATEPEPEPGDETGHDDTVPSQSPEDVLDRLTQYASSARVPDPPPPEAVPEPAAPADDADEPFTAVGDDLLPHPKGEKSKRRRK